MALDFPNGPQSGQGYQGSTGTIWIYDATSASWESQVTIGTQGFQGIQGAQGVQGAAGAQGAVGAQGSQGVQGSQGLTGPTGNSIFATQNSAGSITSNTINFVNTSTVTILTSNNAGILNVSFDTTSNGIGNANLSVSVNAPAGARANQDFWWNSNTGSLKIYYNDGTSTQWVDAFVPTGAQGVQGSQGVQGAVGAQGTQGSQGVQGAVGAQGTQGVQGAQGAVGAQGTQGSQGVQGAVGAQGTQGVQGAQGAQGAQGVQGSTGPIGGSNTQILFNNSSSTGGSANLTFDLSQNVFAVGTNTVFANVTSGLVGVGTSLPSAKLDVVAASFNGGPLIGARFNTANFRMGFGIANSNGFPFLGVNVNNAANDNGTFDISNWASRLRMDNGIFQFQTSSASGTAGNAITWSTYAYLDTSGNLGIGTSSPASKLDVTGGFSTSTTAFTIYNNSASSASNIARIDFRVNNTFNGNERVAAVWGMNPNAAGNNGGALVFGVSANGTATTPSEVGRFDQAGNLGIGTSSPGQKLEVAGNIFVNTSGNPYAEIKTSGSGNNPSLKLTADTNSWVFQGTFSSAYDDLQVLYNATKIFGVNNLGNFELASTTTGNGHFVFTNSADGGTQGYIGDAKSLISGAANSTLGVRGESGILFGIGATERARITSGGELLLGTTSALVSGGRFQLLGVALAAAANIQVGTNGYAAINFNNTSGAQQGYIVTNAASVAYTSVSDYRLKNTVAPMTGALAKVALLKPVTYKWNADGSDGQGFIAHELAEVVPDCVTGEKDAVDVEGNPRYQGVDTSFLVATLTAAIQEQQVMINELMAKFAALESK